MKKSPLKIIVIILIVLALLLGGGIAALYVLLPPAKIVALIVPEAEKALGRKVALEKAGISVYPTLGVSLSGLSVANTQREGFSKEPFIRVEKFSVGIAIMSLFKGSPEITSILIRKPEIRVEVDKNGAFNFDDLAIMATDTAKKKETKQGGLPVLPVPITLKKFAIENGVVVYDDLKAGNQVILGCVNDNMAVAMDKQLKDIKTTGDLVFSRVSVRTKEIKKPLSNLTITLSHDIAANLADEGGVITINKVRLSLQKIFLELKGSVKNAMSPAPELDLAIVSDPISISDALKEIPVELAPMIAKITGGGTMELGLTVKGAIVPDKPLPVQGNLALKSVTIKFTDLPKAINDLNADIAFTDNSLAINALKMQFGANPIELKATVDNFKKPVIDAALKADINLGDMKDVFQLPPDATLDGRLVADIKAKGEADPADPTKLDLKGKVDLQKVTMVWSPLLKPAVITGTLTLSSKAVGQNMAVTIGQSSLSMNTTIANYLSFILPDSTKKLPRTTIDMKLTSPFLNVDETVAPPPPAKEGAKSDAPPAPIAPLPNMDLRALVTANKIIYQGFSMSSLVLKINIINNIANMNFSTGFAGGTIANALSADMRNAGNVTFKNNLTIKNIEVNDLMARFGEYIKPVTPLNRELASLNKCLFGRINLQSSLAGSGGTVDDLMKSLSGNIAPKMASGKIVNAPAAKVMSSSFASFLKTSKIGNFDEINFRDLSATIRLANGQAIFDNLKIMSDVSDWDVKGVVGFDALMNMTVSSRLNKDISGKLLAAENAVKGGLKTALGNTQLAGAAGLLGNMNLVPRDGEGRVTVKCMLGGPVADPKVTGLAFGAGTTGAAQQKAATPQQQAREKVQQVVEQKKEEVKQAVEEKKEEAKQEVKQAEEQVKQKAKNKLKGLLR
jgi:uncharacterized protein involved in outer membrane biogenesis